MEISKKLSVIKGLMMSGSSFLLSDVSINIKVTIATVSFLGSVLHDKIEKFKNTLPSRIRSKKHFIKIAKKVGYVSVMILGTLGLIASAVALPPVAVLPGISLSTIVSSLLVNILHVVKNAYDKKKTVIHKRIYNSLPIKRG